MQGPLTEYWIRISKDFSDEHLYKNLLDTISTQELDASLAREFTTKTRMDMSQEPFLRENLQEKYGSHRLGQWKRTGTRHKSHSASELTGKCRPRSTP